MHKQFLGATGALVRHVPAGAERDDLLMLVRIGAPFARQQHIGRRPGFLYRYIAGLVTDMPAPTTFEHLLAQLELAAIKRNGGGETPIEHCSRTWGLLTYHDPKKGRVQVTFGRLRNILTAAKKARFPRTAKP